MLTTIVEASQTADGQWYPARVERESQSNSGTDVDSRRSEFIIQIDTEPVFVEGVFTADHVFGAQSQQ